ncbi:MAG: YihY/virulence factor BrkB family protein [Anaerolineae bacterium]|nr:YihY/virulence factor BrkB family protein [Anaerolineae bacterium]
MKQLKQLLVHLQRWWTQRSQPTQSLGSYIWKAITNFTRTNTGGRQAAGLAYYAIFSIFPLTLLLAVNIGRLVGPAVAEEQIIQGLQLFLPQNTVDLIQTVLTDTLQQGNSFGLVATVALLWAALGLFNNISHSLDSIFGATEGRGVWRQRVLTIIMGLTLIVLVGASFVTSGVLRLISALTPGNPSIWVTIGTFFLPIGLDIVIFALLFQYVPTVDVHWDAVWPAAVFGAVGWEVAKQAFEWYLTNLANYQIIYGSIATGIVLLFWAWVIASIFLFSAQLCARLNEWLSDYEAYRLAEHEQPHSITITFQEELLPPPPPLPELETLSNSKAVLEYVETLNPIEND